MNESTAPVCAVDQAPLTDQGWICHPCTTRLALDLRDVPRALRQLDVTLTRQDVLTKGGKGNGDKPLPINLRVSELAGQIRAVLYGWAKVMLEEGGDDYDDADWIAADRDTAGWLAAQVNDIRMREWAGDLTNELREALERVDPATDRHEERQYAGPCGYDAGGQMAPCTEMLWAKLDATDEADIRCGRCLHVWNLGARRSELLDAARDEWLDATRVASLVSLVTRQRVTTALIGRLFDGGHIRAQIPVDPDDDYTPALFRVRDVLDNLKHADDHKPANASEVARWLRDVHGIDLGPGGAARIRQWAVRYPDEITREGDGFNRQGVLAVASRLTVMQVGAA